MIAYYNLCFLSSSDLGMSPFLNEEKEKGKNEQKEEKRTSNKEGGKGEKSKKEKKEKRKGLKSRRRWAAERSAQREVGGGMGGGLMGGGGWLNRFGRSWRGLCCVFLLFVCILVFYCCYYFHFLLFLYLPLILLIIALIFILFIYLKLINMVAKNSLLVLEDIGRALVIYMVCSFISLSPLFTSTLANFFF